MNVTLFSHNAWPAHYLFLILSLLPLPSFADALDCSNIGELPLIVVDQFGYLPNAEKVAVVRRPMRGRDASKCYKPGKVFEVIDHRGKTVFSGDIKSWKWGRLHDSSGDKVWWFDFSSLQTPGRYRVRDQKNQNLSPEFEIKNNLYRPILIQATRTFFYQRAGIAKQAPYAEKGWIDGASHIGPLQDTQVRLFSDPGNKETERDLSGGWYDAGDYNKYTNWTADYVVSLLHSYLQNPNIWTDDFNIPESGNGVPDLLDEIKWGLDWLLKMQNPDGSVLSIVGLSGGSPPSAARGPSFYGPANTSATITSAGAFALASSTFALLKDKASQQYSKQLKAAALSGWQWAEDNPEVIFKNNDLEWGSRGLGAGQQEVGAKERLIKKLSASVYLFELTKEARFRDFFDREYRNSELIASNYVSAFKSDSIHTMLYYTSLPGATPSVAKHIRKVFSITMEARNVWQAQNKKVDPYRAYIQDYTWGSSRTKAGKGNLFYDQLTFFAGDHSEFELKSAALNYLHYLHGVNPNGKVYLSNMGRFGAENSVDQFYHSWFKHGSELWDSVTESTYGPPPGFLVGGPNPQYRWDKCCPKDCGQGNNHRCVTTELGPPFDEPEQKAYFDFNDSWPLNSWEVTENSNGYQVQYIRLLSKFVSNGD